MHQLRGRVKPQLFFDVPPVHGDRLVTKMQLIGDLFRGFALPDELEDIELPIGQFLHG